MGQTCETCIQTNIEHMPVPTIGNSAFQEAYNKIKCEILSKQSQTCMNQFKLNENTIFIGQLNSMNKKEGYGQLKCKQKIYAGNFKNDLPHGNGVLIDRDYCYFGQFFQGKPHGKGQQRRKQLQFIGKFANGKRQKGKFTHPQYQYEGQFKNDLFEGKGKIRYFQHDTTYEGMFRKGKFHGEGLIKYKGKFKYEGQFVDGVYHGKGLMLSECGQIFEGRFHEGKKHGQGRIETTDGNQVVNNWKNGNLHGVGTIKKQGQFFQVQWNQGKVVENQNI